MKADKKKLISIIVVVVVLLTGYFVYESMMFAETDNAQVEATTVMLTVKVPGYVKKVNVKEGQLVKAGDVLAEIDERDYQNTLTQMKAELVSSQAKSRDAEKNYKRLSELYKKEVISQQQYDQSSTQYQELKAKAEALDAQVAQAQLNLENTKVIAPSNGFIAKKSVEVGQLANPGIPLLGFVDSEERWVTANFKETDVDSIKIGAEVEIKIDAIGSRKFTGKVDSLSSATGATFTLLPPDNATGNFTKVVQRIPVKILFENITAEDIQKLRAGLSAVVKVHKR
jgi:membrane fusion protein (multidrug efflux system)